ncbi:MAG: anhydro-N-acetylmuramic acid kinase [Armatimonadota bacterium]
MVATDSLYRVFFRETSLTVVGLMAGTSMDGIDAALVDVLGSGIDARILFRGFECLPYPRGARERLLRVSSGQMVSVNEISELNYILGELFAEAAIYCAGLCGLQMNELDIIASHGQTIYHQGCGVNDDHSASTLQIAEAAVIAERTGVLVVSDFRSSDIAAGGEGAPLVPYFDFVFLRDESISRVVQNIGGIANLTYLPAGCKLDNIVAFDTGPGNMLIDAAVARFTNGKQLFDRDGQIARLGVVDRELLERLLDHPYYARRPPKSAGREQFGADYLEEVLSWPEARKCSQEDIVATLTALTAETIVRSYREFIQGKVEEIVLCGGGACNLTLVDMIRNAVDCPVRMFDEFGIPSEAKEAVAFAFLGSETVRGVPANVPSATGAVHHAILGKISLPIKRGEVEANWRVKLQKG